MKRAVSGATSSSSFDNGYLTSPYPFFGQSLAQPQTVYQPIDPSLYPLLEHHLTRSHFLYRQQPMIVLLSAQHLSGTRL